MQFEQSWIKLTHSFCLNVPSEPFVADAKGKIARAKINTRIPS